MASETDHEPPAPPPADAEPHTAPDPSPEPAGDDSWIRHPRMFLHVPLLLAACVGAVAHQAQYWHWYIEDAAISFAYARNWAWGEGLVAYPGGERLEGYSNFTWVALLAVFELLGFDSFDSSKVLQAILAFLTVPFTYLVAREAVPDERSHAPIASAAYLAIAATFAVWGACGLENALFNLLMAAALWRSAVEIRTGGFPWAAGLWFLLAITRPEAILYCAVAGFLSMCFTLREHGIGPTLKWLAVFFVPFGIYHAVRFWYFAFEFPQTYYGKMTTKVPKMSWNTRGWRYVRNWSHDLWTAYFLPLWYFGLLGTRGWRFVVALIALLGTAFLLMYPSNEALDTVPWWPQDLPAPQGWVNARSFALVFQALTLPLFAIGSRRGWKVRVLCWGVAVSVLFFSIYTLGDWMKAWRWMNLLQVPTAVLFGLGADAIADALDRGIAKIPMKSADLAFWAVLQITVVGVCLLVGHEFVLGRWVLLGIVECGMLVALVGGGVSRKLRDGWTFAGWTAIALVTATAVLPNLTHTRAIRGRPETGPFSIKKRVEFVRGVKEKLELEGRIVDLDVDQGAHLWWGRDDFAMMDIAGLVDIPLAQHRFKRPFVKEYIYSERRPHFAHVHGGWASNSRIPTFPEWRRQYVEIPGYPAGKTQFHIGNHVRRDLFLKPHYDGPADRHFPFEKGVVLEGFDLPSEPATGRMMWIEIAVREQIRRKAGQATQLLLFAHRDGQLHTWDVPLGYGWLLPEDWRADEVWVGKIKLPIPLDFEPGSYDLGFVFTGPLKTVLRPEAVIEPDDAPRGWVPELPSTVQVGGHGADPILASGELVFPGALRVVSPEEMERLSVEDWTLAVETAKKGRCEEAEQMWRDAWHHRPLDRDFKARHEQAVHANLAICWSWRAEQQTPADLERAATYLENARKYDHRTPAYLKAKDPVADALYAQGMEAFADEDWETAFTKLSAVLRADPWRSWARRYAERARAKRLGIDPETEAAENAQRMKDKEEAAKRREKVKAKAKAKARKPVKKPDGEK